MVKMIMYDYLEKINKFKNLMGENYYMSCKCIDESGLPAVKCLGTCRTITSIVYPGQQIRAQEDAFNPYQLSQLNQMIKGMINDLDIHAKWIDGFKRGFEEGKLLGD